MHLNTFIQALGREASSEEIQAILKELQLSPPILGRGEETSWLEREEYGYELAFKDEASINHDKYADIGDGELIFMTAYSNKPDAIDLPYDVTANDTYEEIASKIGSKEDHDYELLSRKSWLFTNDANFKYVLSLTFTEDYQTLQRIGVIYSYGQLPWVKSLTT